MRLHSLRLSAFGPFAGTEEVDFDALTAAGLFLFTGPTGAGKTSVLDAVCFALYGQVPGARQAGRSLRSDHAPDGSAPEVVLEASVGGRRLRITRSPAWERPKLRGAGTITEQSRVLVQELVAGELLTVSTRLDEAGQFLGRLIGLSMAQFCQVVLLPQGQFADFLRADADRRRALLETLFDTRRFADVESWLVARRQETARDLAAADDELRQVLARVAEATGVEPPADLTPDAACEWVNAQRAEAHARRELASTEQEEAAAAAAAAAAALADGQRLADLQSRAARLVARLGELETAQDAQQERVAELETARRVAPVLPLLAHLEQTEAELAAVELQVGARIAPVAEFLAATGTETAQVAAVRPADLTAAQVGAAARSAFDELGELRRAAAEEAEAKSLEREAEALARARVGLEARAEQVTAWLAGADGRRAALEQECQVARSAAARRDELAGARGRATARVEAATCRDGLVVRLAAAGDVVRARTDAHQQAREHEQSIREARLAGMAAELAGSLRDGADCPVCGSPTHPRPAVAAQPVSRADEEAATAATARAEAARRAAEAALSSIQVELAEQRSLAGGDIAVADLTAELAVVEATLADVDRQVAGLASAEVALQQFEVAHESHVREKVSLDEQTRSLSEQEAGHRARARALIESVAEARGGDVTVAARVARFTHAADDLVALAELLGDRTRLRRAVTAAQEQVAAALAERDLESPDEVRAGARPAGRIDELERARRAHEAELAAVGGQLADPALAAAAASPPPDLAVLHSAADQTDSARTTAAARATAAAARADALARLAATVERTLELRAPLAHRHRVADGLSRLAEGKSADNRLRMSLSAYVLAARLEQVAASASHRLQRMSSGRYSILHSAEAGPGQARGGLSLRVLDAWTGQERDPSTLSGGESFSASLALALGLADVVTAEAGGTLLETLFVDEGFGSLDDDTLDEVMSVLDDLRDGGRTVGIVSHVADLRQRIPAQLRIEKGRAGSVIAG